jgi:hypothetical protein
MKSSAWRAWSALAVAALVVSAAACGGETSASDRAPVKTSAWLDPGTVLSAATVALDLVTEGGACAGADHLRDRTVWDHVDVQETADAVTVLAYTRIDDPIGAGGSCADVGLRLQTHVSLSAPLGARTLLDGACTPPIPLVVQGTPSAECHRPDLPPVPATSTSGLPTVTQAGISPPTG